MGGKSESSRRKWRDPDDAPEITQEWVDSANLYHGKRLVRRAPACGSAQSIYNAPFVSRSTRALPGRRTGVADANRSGAEARGGESRFYRFETSIGETGTHGYSVESGVSCVTRTDASSLITSSNGVSFRRIAVPTLPMTARTIAVRNGSLSAESFSSLMRTCVSSGLSLASTASGWPP